MWSLNIFRGGGGKKLQIGNGQTEPSLIYFTYYVVSTSDETTQCGICLTSNKNLHWASGGDVWAKNCIFFGGGGQLLFSLKIGVLLGKYFRKQTNSSKSVYMTAKYHLSSR